MLQEVLRVGHLGIWTESVVASQANEWLLTWVLWIIWECSGGGDMEGIQTEVRAQWNAQRNKRLWPWGSKRALRISFSSLVHSLGKSYTKVKTIYNSCNGKMEKGPWKSEARVSWYWSTALWAFQTELIITTCLGQKQIQWWRGPIHIGNLTSESSNCHQIVNWEPARSALRAFFLWQKYPSPGISTPLYLHSLHYLGLLSHSQHTSIVITQGTGILGGSAHSESRTNPKPQS